VSRLRNGYTPKQEAIRRVLEEIRVLYRELSSPPLGSVQKSGIEKELVKIYDRLNARLPESLQLTSLDSEVHHE